MSAITAFAAMGRKREEEEEEEEEWFLLTTEEEEEERTINIVALLRLSPSPFAAGIGDPLCARRTTTNSTALTAETGFDQHT